mmetsp:Transcript_28521/g.77249  ORF Transcript_28521/g.77249 Transcript_28521/m.77249 type:complete len:244 (-) Transcript_28521:373-1104(-)
MLGVVGVRLPDLSDQHLLVNVREQPQSVCLPRRLLATLVDDARLMRWPGRPLRVARTEVDLGDQVQRVSQQLVCRAMVPQERLSLAGSVKCLTRACLCQLHGGDVEPCRRLPLPVARFLGLPHGLHRLRPGRVHVAHHLVRVAHAQQGRDLRGPAARLLEDLARLLHLVKGSRVVAALVVRAAELVVQAARVLQLAELLEELRGLPPKLGRLLEGPVEDVHGGDVLQHLGLPLLVADLLAQSQ